MSLEHDKKYRRMPPKCPCCLSNKFSRVEVTKQILMQNRDAIFSCGGCGFQSILLITYRPIGRQYENVRPFRQYQVIEDGEILRFIPWSCAQCNGPAIVRSSFSEVPSITRCYVKCRDKRCGGTYVAFLEHFEQLTFNGRNILPEVPFSKELIRNLKSAVEEGELRERRINVEP